MRPGVDQYDAQSVIRTVSVVIPCFRQTSFLLDAVESVEDGDLDPEIIVVNDGSDEPGAEAVFSVVRQRGHIVIDQDNAGLAAARNAGFAAATTPFVLALDADNQATPEYLRQALSRFDASGPEVAAVYSDATFFGDRVGPWKVGSWDIERLVGGNYIDACAVVRRSAWEDLGGYDAAMPRMGFEDWDLWLGVAERGWRLEYIPEPLFDYRVRATSMAAELRPEDRRILYKYVARKHRDLFMSRLEDLWAVAAADGSRAQADVEELRRYVVLLEEQVRTTSAELMSTQERLQDVHDSAVEAHASLDKVRAEIR